MRRARSVRKSHLLLVGGLTAAVGVTVLGGVLAAGTPVSIEPETGSLANGATVTTAAGASGTGVVKFGTGTGGTLSLSRIPWEGGPQYWAQFSKANASGWADPNFFPISVFLSSAEPRQVDSLKDAGVNLYMGVEHSPGVFPLTNITSKGMYAMVQQNEWIPAEVGTNNGVVSWFISDECDQGEGACGGLDAAGELALQNSWISKVRGYNDGRFLHANFGNGIVRTFWAPQQMPGFVQGVDSASADKYTYTSPPVDSLIDGVHDAPDWPNGVPVARAYSYGWQADQMRRFEDPAHLRPIWTFVETRRPYLSEADARDITPQQTEGAVWSAIIHEARGVAYFQHNNSPNGCTANFSIVDCTDVHATVKKIDADVKALAPVLNTQSYYNATRVVNGFTYYQYSFNNGTDTMLKTYNGSAYIFAGLGMHCSNTSCSSGTADGTGSKTFTLPAGITGTTVTVVGENRTLPVINGTFTDSFAAEYTHHIYQIAL